MPVAAISRPVVTVSHWPERALKMPDTRQSDASDAQRRTVELRRLVSGREVADMRPVLLAVAAIEIGIVRLQKAGADLRLAGWRDVADAVRQRVVAA